MRPPKSDRTHVGRPTLQDVAAKAGVSVMSVSRVLNNQANVGPEIRALVKRAVRDLNYVPNQAARKLAERQESHNIAFLFATPNAAMLGEMIDAGFTEAAACSAELVFIKLVAERDYSKVRKTLTNLGIEGVILSPPLCDDQRLLHALSAAGVRLLAIGSDATDLPHSTIGIDDTRAARQLTQHLLELGHRRIGFIGGSPRHRSSSRRHAGYEAALLEYGLAPEPSLQWQGEYNYASGLVAAGEALGGSPRPNAVFAANDDMAAAVISVARARGIAVPASLTVCGFDDSEIACVVSP